MEAKIKSQIAANPKNGIYEVFINQQDYYTYFGLGTAPSPNMNQKMFAVIWDCEVENICLEENRAWAELKSIAEEEGVNI